MELEGNLTPFRLELEGKESVGASEVD